MELAICCFASASFCFHSRNSFFHSLSNSFSALDRVLVSWDLAGTGSPGSSVIPLTWLRIAHASSAQKNLSLYNTQLEPETSSFGIHRNLSPSFEVVVIPNVIELSSYKSEFYEESSLYGQMPAKILADVTPK